MPNTSGAVVHEFWAFGGAAPSPQLRPVGQGSEATVWDGSTNPGPGKYDFVTELWYGSGPGAMVRDPNTITSKVNIKAKKK